MLGTGAIVKRPRVIVDEFGNESIGVRSVCYLPLTYDHRLIDGADAGPVPDHHQAPARRGRIRGRPGAVDAVSNAVVAIAGSSGLIGTALVYALRATDNRVLRIVRRAPSNADEVFWNPDGGEFDASALRGVDAAVNLCGVNVGAKRWSGAFKQSLRDSRIGPTEVLSAAVVEAGVPVLINASAVGYYGDTGSRIADESAPAGRRVSGPAVSGLGGRDSAGPTRRCARRAGAHGPGVRAVGRASGPDQAAVLARAGRAAWVTAASTCRGSASRTRCGRCCLRSRTTSCPVR